MSDSPRRGDVWITDADISVLVISSTVYNDIPSEPTVIVVHVFDTEPDTGFGVGLGDGWAAPGLVTSLRKARLSDLRRRIGVQALTDATTCSSKSSRRRIGSSLLAALSDPCRKRIGQCDC